MKIAQVCPYDLFQHGGVQQHILDLSQTLRLQGHSVTIIAPGDPVLSTDEIFLTGKKRRINFNQTGFDVSIVLGDDLKNLKGFLAKECFDVIHFHTLWTPFLSWQIFKLSKSRNVATFHDTPPTTLSGNITRQIFKLVSRFLLPRIDAVIAASESPALHLKKAKKDLSILPPCINYDPFYAIERKHKENTCPNILFLSRLETRKGVFTLLKALKKLNDHKIEVHLNIAGDGHQMSEVKQFINDNKLNNITLLGSISDEDKLSYFAQADIFCAPSIYGESFGIVLAEAMASGIPVIGAANSGYSQVLKGDGKIGLFEPNNFQELYEKLALFLASPELLESLSLWGKKQAKQYDCKEIIQSFEKLY